MLIGLQQDEDRPTHLDYLWLMLAVMSHLSHISMDEVVGRLQEFEKIETSQMPNIRGPSYDGANADPPDNSPVKGAYNVYFLNFIRYARKKSSYPL